MKTQFIDNVCFIKKHYKLSLADMEEIFGMGSPRTQGSYVNGETDPSYLYLLRVAEVTGVSILKLCFESIISDELPERIGKHKYIVSEPAAPYGKSLESRVAALERWRQEVEKE